MNTILRKKLWYQEKGMVSKQCLIKSEFVVTKYFRGKRDADMFFFKQKLPAKKLATFLMVYTVTADREQHDAGAFVLGPHAISTTDGKHVRPARVKRTHWEHLSSHERKVVALTTMYLRGFAVLLLVDLLVKSSRVRDAIISAYEDFWRGWTIGDVDYLKLYKEVISILSAKALLSAEASGKATVDERQISQICEQLGAQFSSLCDPDDIIRDPLRSEIANKGINTFRHAVYAVSTVLEGFLQRCRITAE